MATRAKANLPVNYQEQLAKEAAEISKRIATPSGDRIRFNSNRSLITPDGNEGEELEEDATSIEHLCHTVKTL